MDDYATARDFTERVGGMQWRKPEKNKKGSRSCL